MQTEYEAMELPELVTSLRDQMNNLDRPLIVVGVSSLIATSGIDKLIKLASSDRVVCRSTLGYEARDLFLKLNRERYFGNFQIDKPNIIFVVWEQPSELENINVEGVHYAEFDYFGNIVFADRERTIEQSIEHFEKLNNGF